MYNSAHAELQIIWDESFCVLLPLDCSCWTTNYPRDYFFFSLDCIEAQHLFWCETDSLPYLLEHLDFWGNDLANSILLQRAAHRLRSSKQHEELAEPAVGCASYTHAVISAPRPLLELYSLRSVEIYCCSNQLHTSCRSVILITHQLSWIWGSLFSIS